MPERKISHRSLALRIEALRRRYAEIEGRLGVAGALADEEANEIDAELVELEKRLPDGYE